MSRRLTLSRELKMMKKLQTETLSMHFSHATSLRDDLKGAEEDIFEDEIVSAVLAGLPKQYEVYIAVMEYSDKALTIDTCLANLLAARAQDWHW
jgi:gag-polypeptide of LTR copia-type